MLPTWTMRIRATSHSPQRVFKICCGRPRSPQADYNTIKALVEGNVNTFMGFTFKRISNKIMPLDTVADVRTCVAWAKSGIKITDSGKEVHIDVRPDKSHALQIRTVAALGGTRMEEVKVVAVMCDESP